MSFTIAHLTDVHLGPLPRPRLDEIRLKRLMGYVNWKRARERLSDMAALARLVADMRAQRPDHIAVTGDLVNIALPSEFRRAAEWMLTLGDPANVSLTPGNHDAYVRDAMPCLAEAFAPWTVGDAEYAQGETFPFVRVRGEVALIGLSTATPTGPLMATGRLGARQIEALAAVLQRTGAQNLARVILIHHPPLSRGGAPLRSCLAEENHAVGQRQGRLALEKRCAHDVRARRQGPHMRGQRRRRLGHLGRSGADEVRRRRRGSPRGFRLRRDRGR